MTTTTKATMNTLKQALAELVEAHGAEAVQAACGDLMPPPAEELRRTGRRRSILERFLAFVGSPSTQSNCWPWLGSSGPDGYGRFHLSPCLATGLVQAHRAAYLLFRGPIPPGLQVLHRCDNPPCVRPGHLFVGTQKENMADCRAKGRANRARGKELSFAKLTAENVLLIRRDHRAGSHTHAELARRHGVGESNIRAIINRQTWKHLTEKFGDE
jgi:hypothetical protein